MCEIDSTTYAPTHPTTDRVIWRSQLRPDRTTGEATVIFRGTVHDATTDLWVERSRGGRVKLFAEVTPTDDTATEVTVALVPTGKATPALTDGSRALRLGSGAGVTVYLMGIDSSIDRAAYETERARREAERAAQRQLDAAGCGDPNCAIC